MAFETTDQTPAEVAERILRDLFAERRRIRTSEAMDAANQAGISSTTLNRVRQVLGIRSIRSGPLPGYWERPEGGVA